MGLTLSLTDIFWLVALGAVFIYVFTNITSERENNRSVERRVVVLEENSLSPRMIIDLINRLMADVIAINMNQSVHSSPKSLQNFKINDILTNALIKDGRMSLEELKTLAFMTGLDGADGIDFRTQSSAALGILKAASKRNKVLDVAKYVNEVRPDIFEDENVSV